MATLWFRMMHSYRLGNLLDTLSVSGVLHYSCLPCICNVPQEHSAEVGESISEVVRRLEVTRTQKSEGEAYRGASTAVASAS